MGAKVRLKEVDQVEILTLSDNYNDLLTMDSSEKLVRAMPIKNLEVKGSILAEHGFSTLVKTVSGEETHDLFFDFGYSEVAAPYNLAMMEIDLSGVEAGVLSHGHMDHFGGLLPIVKAVPNRPLPVYAHPIAFRPNRYIKAGEVRIKFPSAPRDAWKEAGVEVKESAVPVTIADGTVLFLGEIERLTDFEKGMPNTYYEDESGEHWDPIEDDTAIVMNLHGKGLVVLSGCSHAGIVNTVAFARKVTGVDEVHVIIGGFHLTGPAFEPIIERTVAGLQAFDPEYVIPAHCTGRKAVMAFEKAMPDQFLLNMAGTRFIFRA